MQIFIYMEPWQPGGMPEMVFEYILKQKGLDPAADLSIDQSIDFGSTAAAFSGGTGDFTVEFEPGATSLEKEGKGYVVDSLGVESGYVPYTAYCARGSYLKENEKTVQNFVNALKKGMEYVSSHTPEEIANNPQVISAYLGSDNNDDADGDSTTKAEPEPSIAKTLTEGAR